MASVLMHFLVLVFVWPFAVPFGALLGLLYRIYPVGLISAFVKYGGYLLPGATTSSVTIEGIEINYLDRKPDNFSSESPTVVLVHGLTSNKLSWVPIIKILPKSWRIIALDLPGHGDSGFRDDFSYSTFALGKLLHEFFVTVGLKKFHLVGESLGALVSAQYASQHPETPASISLLSPPGAHRIGANGTKTMEFLDSQESADPSYSNPLLPQTPDDFRNMLQLVLFRPENFSFHHGVLDAVVSIQSKHYTNFRKILSDMTSSHETPESIQAQLESIVVPLQVIWGKQDRICDPSGAKVIKRLNRNAKVYIVHKCGHALSMEKPTKCGKLITNFVSQLPTSL